MKGTIKSKQEIERLFQTGRRSSSSCMTVLALENNETPQGRCAFIAGKKLGAAPVRSRCKRVLREVARECGSPWSGYDVVFIAHKRVRYENRNKVAEQIQHNLDQLGIIND